RDPVQHGKRRNPCRHSSHLALNVRHIAFPDSLPKKPTTGMATAKPAGNCGVEAFGIVGEG
ncbi:MAG: hypothetical protein ACJ8AV_13960, partial [Gemmatimonadales bacterium]